ncbi:MAG: hypothetical protein JOZ25_05895, partial [Actinobacteria bacterium]|nr:hypothetical protein [Actinomycetota bacterium]
MAAAALALVAPAVAQGAVSLGSTQVTVSSGAGRVVVDRSPFRLRFEDSAGHTALGEVPNTAPFPGPAVNANPQPGGFAVLPESAVYQPLAFEVGGEVSTQWNQSLYTGNMLFAAGAGSAFAARQVSAAKAAGDGVELTIETTDPTRTMTVAIDPDGSGAFRVHATVNGAPQPAAFGDAFVSGPDEAFHGFGGRHNAIDERGQNLYSWISQENFGSDKYGPYFVLFPGSNAPHYLFPNGPTAAYYADNGFVSSRPYGFLVNQTELTRFRLASDRPTAWQVAVSGSILDYTVALGSGRTSVRRLSRVNGSQPVPPMWAQGPFPYRAVSLGGETVASYEAKVLSDVSHIENDHLGVKAYDYEGWHGLPESFIRSVNARLRRVGVHPVGYLRAFVGNDGGFFDDQQIYNEAVQNGYVAKNAADQPYLYDEAANPAAVIDYTNPAAVRWWEQRVDHMLDLGFDGFMEDFGEQVLGDMRFYDGETGLTMHNRFPVVYHRVTQEILDRYQRAHPRRGPIFTFTRAGFSGRPGAAAFE